MDQYVHLFKALSDKTRLRILILLINQQYCVCELTEILMLPQTKISKHLAKLRDWHLVDTDRDSQFIYYKLKENDSFLVEILTMISETMAHDPILNQDKHRVTSCSNIKKD